VESGIVSNVRANLSVGNLVVVVVVSQEMSPRAGPHLFSGAHYDHSQLVFLASLRSLLPISPSLCVLYFVASCVVRGVLRAILRGRGTVSGGGDGDGSLGEDIVVLRGLLLLLLKGHVHVYFGCACGSGSPLPQARGRRGGPLLCFSPLRWGYYYF